MLEDILKPGIRERFERLRKMGIRTVMVTGDNPLTAKSIAMQAGVEAGLAALIEQLKAETQWAAKLAESRFAMKQAKGDPDVH